MAVLDLGTLKIEVLVVTDPAKKEFDGLGEKSKKTSKGIETDWAKVGDTMIKTGTTLTKYITLPVMAAATAAVKLQSDMVETGNKVNEVFDGNAKRVDLWANNSIRKMGMAKETAMDMASSFGDLGSSMGIESELNYKYSTSLVQLVGDMASFKNISTERAQVALTGIYTGETEALKGLGIVMTEANLEAFALANGYTQQYNEMSQAEKVALRYAYVMDAAKNSMGDFARTSGETANQTRTLGENAKELGAEFGEVLAPTANALIRDLNGLLDVIKTMNPEAKQTVVTTALIAASIGPLVTMIGKGIKAYNDLTKFVAAANIKMQLSAGVIGMVSIALGLLVSAVMMGAKWYGELTQEANKLANATKDATDSIAKSKQTLNDNLVSVDANAKMAQTYCDRLDALSAAETLSNAQRAEAKYLVDQLNATYPELNAQIDEQTGKIVGGTSAIRDQISAMRDKAMAAAYEEQYTAVVAAHAELLYAAAAAEVERSNIQQRNAEITSERIALESQFQAATGMSIDAFRALGSEAQQAAIGGRDAVRKMVLAHWELGSELNDNNVALRALDREIEKNATATKAAKNEVDIYTAAYNKLTGASGTAGTALGDTSAAIADTGEAAVAAETKLKSYTDETINNLERLPGAVKMSAAKATANLQENNATMAQWMSDLSTLVERGMDEGVVAKLYDMGPKFRTVVSDLATGTPEAMQAFADALGASGDLSGQKFAAGIEAATKDATATLNAKSAEVDAWTAQTTTDIAACVDNGIIAKLRTIVPAWVGVIAQLIQANSTNLSVFKQSMLTSGAESGNNFYIGLSNTMSAKMSSFYQLGFQAGRRFVDGYNAAQRSHSPSQEAIQSANNWADGVAIGTVNNTDKLTELAQAQARIPITAVQAVVGQLPKVMSGALPVASPIYSSTTTTNTSIVTRGKVEQHLHYTSQPQTSYERQVEQRRASRELAKELIQ